MLKRFFLSLKGLFDASVLSLTKNENGSAVHSFYILLKCLVLMSDAWYIVICWSSLLFGIFAIKKWLVFSVTSFGTLKYDCVIKTKEIFNFLRLINNHIKYYNKFFGFNVNNKAISIFLTTLSSVSIL